ncbi:sphingosine N-acyltransferase lag1 [Diatrype stigma]|uniref:Sphingosine N-acyltransferase lag1 n=1 Tax=Diatrype stigma TaxID=117547 RepID=A0AAN9UDX0_9PEZI
MTSKGEPFPALSTSADQLHSANNEGAARRRRKSSGLGGEIRAGDTGAPSLHASLAHLQQSASSSSSSSSSNGNAPGGSKKGSKRRKARSLLRRCKHFAIRHTWVIPLAILAVFGALYAANPTDSNPVRRFIFLSYRLTADDPLLVAAGLGADAPPQYGKGLWDIAFVSFYTVVLSFTREFVMQEFLRPLARFCGLRSRGKQARFMEQMYTALYFGVLGPAGVFVMSRTPVWYFHTAGMYAGFPHRTHEAYFKFYYLFQAAYWAQQAIVLMLGMEKPRKDFKELVAHHIVSLALIGLSYRFHFTYMGLAVYITHDISDFFLATSKTLNYLDSVLVEPWFVLFMGMWIYLRHYLNLRIIFSLFTEFKTVGPYELNWETQQYKCSLSFYITLSLLASLQALNLFWLFFIIRIAYRLVVYNQAEDDRSEADESEIEERERELLKEKEEEQKSLPAATAASEDAAGARANGGAKASTKKKAAR